MRYRLELVERFPEPIQPEVLYWSKEFEVSAHVCACGCGDIIKLPIDDQNFRIIQGPAGPTLRPSVGNWHVCDAHYFITDGQVEPLGKMSDEAIVASRKAEDARREAHYARKLSWLARLRNWLQKLLSRLFGGS